MIVNKIHKIKKALEWRITAFKMYKENIVLKHFFLYRLRR